MHSVRHTQLNSREQRDCWNNAPWRVLRHFNTFEFGDGWGSRARSLMLIRFHPSFLTPYSQMGHILFGWNILYFSISWKSSSQLTSSYVSEGWRATNQRNIIQSGSDAMTSSNACVPDFGGTLSQKEELILEDSPAEPSWAHGDPLGVTRWFYNGLGMVLSTPDMLHWAGLFI